MTDAFSLTPAHNQPLVQDATVLDIAKCQTHSGVAAYFGVGRDTVRQWRISGELRAIDVSKNPSGGSPCWRFTPQAIRDFELSRQTVKPSPRRKRRSNCKTVATPPRKVKEFF